MTFLLDTNVVSELRKSAGRIEPGVRRWADGTSRHVMFLSVVTVMEIEIGVRRLFARDTRQAEILNVWLIEHILPTFDRRVLPIDVAVARRAAAMQVAAPRPLADCLIGATAEVHGLTVVTRNVTDFEPLGVSVLNPWS